MLVVLTIFSSLALLTGPVAGKLIRRSHGLAGYLTVRQAIASARLQAVRRVAPVVVELSLTADKRLRVHTFQDRANDVTTPLPADEAGVAGNFVQNSGSFATSPDTDEPTLADVTLPGSIRVWRHGGSKDDCTDGVSFDSYNADATLVNRIVFLPTGGIALPEASNSGTPGVAGGRGIYLADSAGLNFFRVTVDNDLLGRLRVDKYVEGVGYQPRNWTWR
jgi:hypothetical protein